MAVTRKENARWSPFVDELRAHRVENGWSQAELASRINYSEALIAQVETYRRVPALELAGELDRVFGTAGYRPPGNGADARPGTFTRLVLRLRSEAFSAPFGDFAPYEQEADEVFIFEHSLVPGLLQTPDYARWVMRTRPNTSADELQALVDSRLARQAVLTRADPPPAIAWFLLDEGVLHRPVAPADVMRAQFARVLDMTDRPNVTVSVVPYGAGGHSGLLGAFNLAETEGQPSILYIEDVADGRVSQDPALVAKVRLRWRTLQAEAVSVAASRDMLKKKAEES